MNKLIEEQKKNIMLFIRDFVYKMRDSGIDFEEPRRVELEQWAKQIPNQSLTQFIDTEIERLKGMMKESDWRRDDRPICDNETCYAVRAYNQCLEDQISHLEKIKQELV